MQDGFKRAMVVYSEPDDACYVVVQNYRTREVVTVLPLEYWAFDRLTENSAQAWQAREYVLGAETALMEASAAPAEAANGALNAEDVFPVPAEQAEKYVAWHVQRKRLAEALEGKSWSNDCSPEEAKVRVEHGKAMLRHFLGTEIPTGQPHPECHLVLKLMRDPPYYPVVFTNQLLRENFSELLMDPCFVATMVRKMSGRELLNEDMLGVHLEIGDRKFEFSVSEQNAFFAACARCIEEALLGPSGSAEADENVSEKLAPYASIGEGGGGTVLSFCVEQPAALCEELVSPFEAAELVDQVLDAQQAGPASKTVDAPGLGRPLRVKPAPTEFESLLMEAGYGIRRPESTLKKYRAA
ncbi:hypothetical protein AS149_25625 [Burkholderia cenocepacia]|nr:hypothetical protein AS149_25625 [Burkholderia cenocepacia]